MPAPVNRLKAALATGDPQIGIWLNAASPMSAQIAGATGFDWCLIDGEHGPWSPEVITSQLAALELGGTNAVVRVPVGEDWIIKQALDLGAQTLLVPMVDTGEQAAQVVRATRYAPEGKRGLGAAVARVSGWGQIADYATSANAEIGVIVQAETRAAIENLDDILAVEGVDCVFIGPADLSADMGYLGNPGAEEVQAVIADAGRRIRAAGKAAGILHYDSTDYPRYLDLGFNFLGIGADVSLMRTSFAATLAIARAAVKG
ncbi:MAG: HpcH/HpaI aldolase/citrate lyase family protein [Paracoccaceae bacterium]|nr:HpcH/HpaI aldolase/citrate lyase family protein [Maritimibacter sp.]